MVELDAAPLVIFLVTAAVVVACVMKDMSFKTQWGTLTIDYSKPPVIGVLFLLISRSLDLKDVWTGGIVGDEVIRPIYIMIIFNTVAYFCISLDHTGGLSWLALHVVRRAGSSGTRLFCYFYLLSSVITLITSNDIAILTLTPIIAFCSHVTKMDPMPFLLAEFYAANITSAVFLIGNATNIIVGTAHGLSFIEYLRWNGIPAIISALAGFVCLYLYFRKDFVTFTPPPLNPEAALIDKTGAIFGTCLLILNRILLSTAPLYGGEVWSICLATAVICFIHNAIRYPWRRARKPIDPTHPDSGTKEEPEFVRWHVDPLELAAAAGQQELKSIVGTRKSFSVSTTQVSESRPSASPRLNGMKTPTADQKAPAEINLARSPSTDVSITVNNASQTVNDGLLADEHHPTRPLGGIPVSSSTENLVALQALNKPSTHHHAPSTPSQASSQASEDAHVKHKMTHAPLLPTLGQALSATPVQTIPFVFGMFVMVQGLDKGGWIEAFAEGLASIPGGNNPFVAVFWLTFLSTFLCNVLNNQPATILMTRVLVHPKYLAALGIASGNPKDIVDHGTRAASGSMYGVILGSNYAASFTLLGALAGILFAKILSTKNIDMSYKRFAKHGFVMMPFVFLAGCVSLWITTLAAAQPTN